MILNLATAQALIATAIAHTEQQQLPPVSIAILDQAAYPLAFARMDDCFLGAIDVAVRKARTAALFRADSDEVGANFRPGAAAFSLENTNGGLVGFSGGMVLRDATGTVLGAIGVSGASMEQDQQIAAAAAQSLAGLKGCVGWLESGSANR